MRIFYAADNSPNPNLGSNLWRHNLYEPLVDLGHEVVELQYDLRDTFLHLDTDSLQHRLFIRRNRPMVSAELLRQVQAAHRQQPLDLFFSYFYDACVLPQTVDAIRALGIKTVNWYCNGSYQLHLVSEISPHYDWCLVPEKFRLEDYRAMGAHPIYCQEAANPNVYRSYEVPVEYDVTFVGQGYGDRPYFISYLRDHGIDVRVWGPGWQEKFGAGRPAHQPSGPPLLRRLPGMLWRLTTARGRDELRRRRGAGMLTERQMATAPAALPSDTLGPPLSDEQLIKMYSRSRINLGFSSCGETHHSDQRILQVRLRDFEVPMSGGFYMVEYMEELEEFFEIGKEIVCYSGPDDLACKIKYYLEHEDEREAIRAAGHARCRRDHTWHKRFETVFAQMGLPTGGAASCARR